MTAAQLPSADRAPPVDLAIFCIHLPLGGVPRLAVWLAQGFVARGLRVDLVVGRMDDAFPFEITPGMSIVDLGGGGKLATTRALRRYLQTVRPANTLTFVASAIAMVGLANTLAGRVTNFIACEQVDPVQEARTARFDLYKLTLWATPLTYRLADRLVAASKGVARSLAAVMHCDPRRITTVYNPGYRPAIDDLAAEDAAHRWFDQGRQVLVTAARFVPQKDLATLLDAFALVVRSLPEARLLILGDGPERDQLAARARALGIADLVDMPGADPNPFRWFARSHTFVMSSRWEGFGLTLVEAMACGCSIVSTDCPSGPAEVLGDGAYGTLVPLGDSAQLAQALVETLAQPRTEERSRARARAFSLEASLDGYQALMRR